MAESRTVGPMCQRSDDETHAGNAAGITDIKAFGASQKGNNACVRTVLQHADT